MIGARPWQSAPAQAFRAGWSAAFAALSIDELSEDLERLVTAQERRIDDDAIQLYAGTNRPSERVARYLSSTIGSRPNLGPPGDKYNRGMEAAEQLEVLAEEAVCRLFGARYAELRVGSGSLANLYSFMATCEPGDAIMAFDDGAAGHPTHRPEGAAGLYRLVVHDVPFDVTRMDVDVDRLRERAHVVGPRLIIVAGSMCLFPYDVGAVREIADEVGATVLYDAAHMGGLIAGGRFQQPLSEGAHLMTGSTYKAFGGPPSGLIVTDSEELAERLDAIAFPGLTANFDLGRLAALTASALDLIAHGGAYADAMIANARALARALVEAGIAVFEVPARGYTASQHVAVRGTPHGGADAMARRLEGANLLTSTIGLPHGEVGLRLGTQEVTRLGMGEAEMGEIAHLFALAERGDAEAARQGVRDLRARFREVAYAH